MIYTKLVHGWVAQRYDSDTGDCVSMEFIPSDEVERQDENGNPIEDPERLAELDNMEKEVPLDMVQP